MTINVDVTVGGGINAQVNMSGPGPIGPMGPIGLTGPGVPPGGIGGQYLRKNSNNDFDTIWFSLTPASIGLGSVNNTSDLNKPISNATQTALNLKLNSSLLGVANGIASLDGNGLVPASQLPSYVDDVLEYANLAAFPATGATGNLYLADDTGKIYRWSGTQYVEISSLVAAGATGQIQYNTGGSFDASGALTFNGSLNIGGGDGGTSVNRGITFNNSRAAIGWDSAIGAAYLRSSDNTKPIVFGSSTEYARFTGTGFGLLTTAPTHSLTLGSAATGYADYKTVDQTTNYQRYRQAWNGATYEMGTDYGGSSQTSSLRIGVSATAGGTINRAINIQSIFPFVSYGWGGTGLTGTQGAVDIGGGQSFSASAGTQIAFSLTPTILQTATAGYTGALIAPFESSVGSGTKRFLSMGNATAANGVGFVEKVGFDNTGSLLLGASASIYNYQTTDQTTNFVRAQEVWTTINSINTYKISTEFGGTGAQAALQFSAVGGVVTTLDNGATVVGSASKWNTFVNSTSLVAGAGINSFTGGMIASSGTQNWLGLCPTISQTGTTATNVLYISPQFTSNGSGPQYLMNVGSNASANGAGLHSPVFTMTVVGIGYIGSRLGIGGLSTAPGAQLQISGTNNSGTLYGASGFGLNIATNTYTSTSSSGTITTVGANTIAGPVLGSVSAVTLTNASTFYIGGPPSQGPNVTITNPYSVWVETGNIRVGGSIIADGGNFQTSVNSTASNFFGAATTTSTGPVSPANWLFGGAASVQLRMAAAGTSSTVLAANSSYTNTLIGRAPITTNATGTHAYLANLTVTAMGNVSAGGAAVTNTVSLLVDGVGSGGTNNYAVLVRDGTTRLAASTASSASLNLPAGAVPTIPKDGDIWFDGTDLKMRVGGVTKTITLT